MLLFQKYLKKKINILKKLTAQLPKVTFFIPEYQNNKYGNHENSHGSHHKNIFKTIKNFSKVESIRMESFISLYKQNVNALIKVDIEGN